MKDIVENSYPALYTLAQIYFSEDWPDFYDQNPLIAVDAFVNGHPGLSDRLPDEIDALLATVPTEAELGRTFEVIELLYDPPSMDDQTYRAWLVSVSDRVKEALKGQA
jgi:hypothetical protein